MADDTTALLTLVLGSIVVLFALALFGVFAIRRWLWRNHVWFEITTKVGKKVLELQKPLEDAKHTTYFKTNWGIYYPESALVQQHDGGWRMGGLKNLFEFTQGDPRPVSTSTHWVRSTNPGSLQKVSVKAHQVIPSETLAVYMDQHDYADAYSGKWGILLYVFIGLGFVALLVIGLYVER